MKAKKLKRLVDAEIALRKLAEPVTVRTLTIDFENSRIEIDGRTIELSPTHNRLAIPILGTERLILPRHGVAI